MSNAICGASASKSKRRSWLFLPGADRENLLKGPESGADVLIQELEDFVPPARRDEARGLCAGTMAAWKAAGATAAVRINPLWDGGRDDLEAVMPAAPEIVALPKVSAPEHVIELDRALHDHERRLGLSVGATELLPNIESARGVMQTYDIARASTRVFACLVASEDMAADLGAERGRDGAELAYVRARFHLECVAAGVQSIDCPYTWADDAGVEADTRIARRLGFTAKSAVLPRHAAVINRVLTPSTAEATAAAATVAAFEAARDRGADRVEVDGNLVELPTYLAARRLLARARDLGVVSD